MRALVRLLNMRGKACCGGAHNLGHFLKPGGGNAQGIGFALGLKFGLLGLAQRLVGIGRLLSGCLRLALGIFYEGNSDVSISMNLLFIDEMFLIDIPRMASITSVIKKNDKPSFTISRIGFYLLNSCAVHLR